MKITHTVPALLAATALAGVLGWTAQAAEPHPGAAPVAHAATPTPAPARTQPQPPAEPQQNDVAGPGADESGPTRGRPQFHLDDTTARRTALQVAYNECLLAHGARENTGREGVATAAAPGEDAHGDPVGPIVLEPVPAPASAACLSQLPVMPPELEAATNPDFHSDAADYVQCLQDGDLHVELLDDQNLDWTYTAGHPVPDGSVRLEQDCLLSAFSS